MDSNTLLGVASPHHLPVLTKLYLKGPLDLSNVGLVALLAVGLIDHTSPFLWDSDLDLHQGLLECTHWSKSCPHPKSAVDTFQCLIYCVHCMHVCTCVHVLAWPCVYDPTTLGVKS